MSSVLRPASVRVTHNFLFLLRNLLSKKLKMQDAMLQPWYLYLILIHLFTYSNVKQLFQDDKWSGGSCTVKYFVRIESWYKPLLASYELPLSPSMLHPTHCLIGLTLSLDLPFSSWVFDVWNVSLNPKEYLYSDYLETRVINWYILAS